MYSWKNEYIIWMLNRYMDITAVINKVTEELYQFP